MLIEIPDVLSGAQLARVRERLAGAKFDDGKLTAGAQASGVKHNLELPPDVLRIELAQLVCQAIGDNPTFNHFALPRRIMIPIFSRYDIGMAYGSHTDVALMGVDRPDEAVRTDLSLTLFLSDPDDYDGGELTVITSVGENSFKPKAGHCVVYPSHNLHRVAPVTRGFRLAAVTWIQSFVRSDNEREVLFEICNLSEALADTDVDRAQTDSLFNIYHNLTRMWAEA